jgi:hypothetical protein
MIAIDRRMSVLRVAMPCHVLRQLVSDVGSIYLNLQIMLGNPDFNLPNIGATARMRNGASD